MSGEGTTYKEDLYYRRGLRLFTCRWVPAKSEPKALICLCHGYGVDCSVFMEDTGVRLAKAGYAVYGIDSEGHGKSDGLRTYIPSFDVVVGDSADFFAGVAESEEFKNKPKFLLGESMGGAMALLLHRKQPNLWHGAVLVAPMCKISEELKPHPIVVQILRILSKVFPKWRLVPTKSILDVGFQDPQKREKVRQNPYLCEGKLRLQTGSELLRVSLDIEKRLQEVTLPFIVLHGLDDKVTDPSVSRLLYESARSQYKELKMYPKMWHALLAGESQDNANLVYADIIAWLDRRTHAH